MRGGNTAKEKCGNTGSDLQDLQIGAEIPCEQMWLLAVDKIINFMVNLKIFEDCLHKYHS